MELMATITKLFNIFGIMGVGGLFTYLCCLLYHNKGTQTIQDLLRHTYTIGATGTGKSTKCLNDILKIIDMGYGCLYIDIHGQDSVNLLDYIPPEHAKRVIYIDPSDLTKPIGLPIFDGIDNHTDAEIAIDNLISLFNVIWPNFIGPSTEDLLRMASMAVVPNGNATLLEIYLMLVDETYRETIEIKDSAVRLFWKETFPELIKRDKSRLNPPTNKLRKLIMSSICRSVLCQTNPKFSIKNAMENNQIVICNFAKGKLGHETARLLAGIVVCQLQLCTFKRGANSKPFFIFLDEFQNYCTESFMEILSESRKYNISLNLYHQYIAQLPKEIQAAILNNVGSTYAFRLEGEAGFVAKILGVAEEDIKSLPRFTYYCRKLINGEKEHEAHTEKSKPLPTEKHNHSRAIISRSRRLYGTDGIKLRNDIENRLQQEYSDIGVIL